jgi:uncharacterized protein with von Willebrand factor type A (vWA) domain
LRVAVRQIVVDVEHVGCHAAVYHQVIFIRGGDGGDMACIHFSDHLKTWHFTKGKAEYPDVIASCEYFEGGYTPFEPWMREALKLIDESRYQKADVICISDGLSSIDPQTQAEWNRRRREREMRCYAILIGTREGAHVLGHIADALMTIDNLALDQQILDTIFAV